jgi:hypothetical protein
VVSIILYDGYALSTPSEDVPVVLCRLYIEYSSEVNCVAEYINRKTR